MNYQEFISEALKSVNQLPSKDDMEFAFIMFHKQFGETPSQAIKSTLFLNTLKG